MDGAIQILRARAARDQPAAAELARLLVVRGDLDELRARANAGDKFAAPRLAYLLAEQGDLDKLRARANAGDWAAANRLAELLAQQGDLDGAVQIHRARANVGAGSAWELGKLLTQHGRGEEAERLRRFGLNLDGSIARE